MEKFLLWTTALIIIVACAALSLWVWHMVVNIVAVAFGYPPFDWAVTLALYFLFATIGGFFKNTNKGK